MKIALIRTLIARYGRKIAESALATQDIEHFLNPTTFTCSEEYDAEGDISDENYTTADALRLFILELTKIEEISTQKLHDFTSLLITHMPETPEDAFFKKSNIIKFLLAYLKAQSIDITSNMEVLSPQIKTTNTEALANNLKDNIDVQTPFFLKTLPLRFRAAMTDRPAIDSSHPDINFIAELEAFKHHRGNFWTQLNQSIIHKNKKTEAGMTEAKLLAELRKFHLKYNSSITKGIEYLNGKKNTAPAKAAVSDALIKLLENKAPNIATLFPGLLEASNISSEEFFAGKSNTILSAASIGLLTTTKANFNPTLSGEEF